LMGCTRAPITGREQLIFFSEETENKMGIEAYRDVLRQFPLSTNPEANAMIRRVGERIAAAANKPSYDWEFALIQDDKIINAFWERMSGCPRNMIGKLCFRSGAGVPEFLSTHPSEETRIKNIERWIPEAMHYYNPPPDAPPTAPPSKAMG